TRRTIPPNCCIDRLNPQPRAAARRRRSIHAVGVRWPDIHSLTRSSVIDRRDFMAFSGVALLALPLNRKAQGEITTRRIGFLSAFPRANIEDFLSQLRPELKKLGWSEGRNIVFLEARTTDGRGNENLPSLAAELVAQSPDLILVQTVPATRALMRATNSIPI